MYTPKGYDNFDTQHKIEDTGVKIISFTEKKVSKCKTGEKNLLEAYPYGNAKLAWTLCLYFSEGTNDKCQIQYSGC